MWVYKKHNILLMLFVLAAGSGLVTVAVAEDVNLPEETSQTERKTRPVSKANEPNKVGVEHSQFDTNALFYRLILSTVFIIILGAGLWYLSRKLLPRFNQSAGRNIRVLETLSLGSRRAVHLLEVENKRILIGSTSEQITKLTEFSNTFEQTLKQQQDRQNTDESK